MIKKIAILFIAFVALALSAQEQENPFASAQNYDSTSAVTIKPEKVKKIYSGVDLNMGYMFAPGKIGAPHFSFSPHVILPLSSKLWINAGITAAYTYLPNIFNNNDASNYNILPMTRLFIYTSGNYKVSEKLLLTGTAYQQVFYNQQNQRQLLISDNRIKGISVGVNYKIGNNVSIGAQFQINPMYMNSSYYNGEMYPASGYSAPFGW